MAKRTALYQEHLNLKGKMVEFAGWEMPVQYSEGLAAEHEACRNSIGLFDVSHMGEVLVRGERALEFLNSLVTNNVAKIADNQAQYTVMCYDDGGCVDDLIIHRVNEREFFICVNASNTEKDFEWIKSHAPAGVSVEDVSRQYTQIAIQGRHAMKLLQKLTDIKTDTKLDEIKYYWFRKGRVLGEPAVIARTGYTGEDGFEIYVRWDSGPKIWNALIKEGAPLGIKACGLGARDTLRTEMKYPLYGHEIDRGLNPIEAGLGWAVKLDKPDFTGKKALVAIKEANLNRALVGLRSLGRAIPRQGYALERGGASAGIVTSGTFSPSLKCGIAIAYVDRAHSEIGTRVDVIVRDQRAEHEVVETPFYKRPY
ncbi:MAG: glycine cleavage system aminomethyltransferase GcvT [Deltaproteobacteria bacterium]|nr:glycine cleavage system aminomethyltransferase GcvT [Deltaproteobacteria bacterium]